jgi:hypothetical protein
MSPAARSVFAWSIYLLVLGTWLVVAPNTLLKVLGMPITEEIWIRVVGIMVVILALYFYDAAINEARHFFIASVLARLFSAAAFLAFALTGEPWQLAIFVMIDALGAAWTYVALRARQRIV